MSAYQLIQKFSVDVTSKDDLGELTQANNYRNKHLNIVGKLFFSPENIRQFTFIEDDMVSWIFSLDFLTVKFYQIKFDNILPLIKMNSL